MELNEGTFYATQATISRFLSQSEIGMLLVYFNLFNILIFTDQRVVKSIFIYVNIIYYSLRTEIYYKL